MALLGIVMALGLVGQGRAEQEGAWCSHEDIGGDTVTERCHFATFDECRRVSAGQTTTFCTQNPRYVAPSPPQPAARQIVDPRKPG